MAQEFFILRVLVVVVEEPGGPASSSAPEGKTPDFVEICVKAAVIGVCRNMNSTSTKKTLCICPVSREETFVVTKKGIH